MGYLVIKGNNNSETRAYSIGSTFNSKPYMKVSSGYIDLANQTNTLMALNVKIGESTYRPIASETYTDPNHYHSTTRSSQYNTNKTTGTNYYASKYTWTNVSQWTRTHTGWSNVSGYYCNNRDNVTPGVTYSAYTRASTRLSNFLYTYQEMRTSTQIREWDNCMSGSSATSVGTRTTVSYSLTEGYGYIKSSRGNWATWTTCNFQTYDGGNYGSFYCTCTVTGSATKNYSRTFSFVWQMSKQTPRTQATTASRSSGYADYYYTLTSTAV